MRKCIFTCIDWNVLRQFRAEKYVYGLLCEHLHDWEAKTTSVSFFRALKP